MFSTKFYTNLALLLRFTAFFNVSTIRFHKSKQILWCDKSYKATQKTFRKLYIIFLLYIGWVIHTFSFRSDQNSDEINQILAFQLGGLLWFLNLSISAYFSIDICRIFNGLIVYFRRLHRKLI